ncbi:MAG: hypothetical protein CVT83_03135 [Alphaproteobacteria bacterium HGW-Alphaproteobacteria-5]|nr:MAG: hypothetical protein CVT83_03135 [Alphaproteobacteria bacterium HGW-Alphaproteobacteria-5]
MSKTKNGLPLDTTSRRVSVIVEIYFAGLADAQVIDAAKAIAQVIDASDEVAGLVLRQMTRAANIGIDPFGLDVCDLSGNTTDFRRADALAKHLYGLEYKALEDAQCGYVYALAKAIRQYDELAGFTLVTAGGLQ